MRNKNHQLYLNYLTLTTQMMMREMEIAMIQEDLHLSNQISMKEATMTTPTRTQKNKGDTMVGKSTCFQD